MVLDLFEADGSAKIAAALERFLKPSTFWLMPVLSQLDYIFWGRSNYVPDIWFCGGLTVAGKSVTGSGQSLEDAFCSVAGEVAESVLMQTFVPKGGPSCVMGYGAGNTRRKARRHALFELMERHFVQQWWAGTRAGRLLPADMQAHYLGRSGQYNRVGRVSDIVSIADLAFARVVVAVSFEPDKRGFCFGAACRETEELAAGAALSELAQAEVGLDIARYKHRNFGANALGHADQIGLAMAAAVDADAFFATPLVSNTEQEPRMKGRLFHISTKHLGRYADCFHVEVATAQQVESTVDLQNTQFGALNLY